MAESHSKPHSQVSKMKAEGESRLRRIMDGFWTILPWFSEN